MILISWVLWGIGIFVTIVTAVIIREYYNDLDRIWIYMLVTFCIVTVGGIADGKFIGAFCSYEAPNVSLGVIFLCVMGLTYIVGLCVLGLYYFDNVGSHCYFIAVFIISVIAWAVPSYNYHRNYEENIERITETIEYKEERQLIYFCNVPVQGISGSVEGSFILGGGSVSGTTTTTHEISYMYVKGNNEGDWGFAPVETSKIVFFNDDTTPYVEIISYKIQTTIINHNNGTESTRIDKEWTEYEFHLPEQLKQYKLE